MTKTQLTAGIAIGTCFTMVPLWIFELINKTVLITVFVVAMLTLVLLVTGVLGKIFNKK